MMTKDWARTRGLVCISLRLLVIVLTEEALSTTFSPFNLFVTLHLSSGSDMTKRSIERKKGIGKLSITLTSGTAVPSCTY